VAEFNLKSGKAVSEIGDAVWAELEAHRWPGNVRELRNVVERCVLFSDGPAFPVEWLQLKQGERDAPKASQSANTLTLPLDGSMSLEEMDRFIVKSALEKTDYNLTAAARNLGTTRQTLRYRAQKYDLKGDSDEDAKD
jgi:transcriptional regulator with PAS, ATPase and Fis domain